MENSAVNQAHQQSRRAEAHLRYRRFNEAVECHRKAADLLSEALNYTENVRLIESLRLQRDSHYRQINFALIKKEQYDNYLKAVESRRKDSTCSTMTNLEDHYDNASTSIQIEIYRNMKDADALLEQLVKSNSDLESLKSFSTTDTDDKEPEVVGTKHPKTDEVIIEELRTLKDQLYFLVYKLVNQLESSKQEVCTLKDRVKQLENEKGNSNKGNLKVITDSSGGTSPYVFSPLSEFSPDMQETRMIPDLQPLEVPNFDFNCLNNLKNNSINEDDEN